MAILLGRIYAVSWAVVAGLAVMLLMAGRLTTGATLVLGFIASVLSGAGLLVLYPVLMNEEVTSQRRDAK